MPSARKGVKMTEDQQTLVLHHLAEAYRLGQVLGRSRGGALAEVSHAGALGALRDNLVHNLENPDG